VELRRKVKRAEVITIGHKIGSPYLERRRLKVTVNGDNTAILTASRWLEWYIKAHDAEIVEADEFFARISEWCKYCQCAVEKGYSLCLRHDILKRLTSQIWWLLDNKSRAFTISHVTEYTTTETVTRIETYPVIIAKLTSNAYEYTVVAVLKSGYERVTVHVSGGGKKPLTFCFKRRPQGAYWLLIEKIAETLRALSEVAAVGAAEITEYGWTAQGYLNDDY